MFVIKLNCYEISKNFIFPREEHISMTLTKSDLKESIHKSHGLSRKKSTVLVETILEIIKSELESGIRQPGKI